MKFKRRPQGDKTDPPAAAGRGGTESSGFQPYRSGDLSVPGSFGAATTPVARPTPLPKRHKGRFFVAGLLLAVCAMGVYSVWDSFFRYRAYGIVTGRVMDVSVPWDGSVQYIHISEGDPVHQGQVLMTLDNIELRQRLGQLEDELRLAQANLDAEVSKLKWEKQWQQDRYQDARVEYYEVWGKLLEEEATLSRLQLAFRRAKALHGRQALSNAELEQARLAERGQRDKVGKLRTAVEEARLRAEETLGRSERGTDQLKPKLLAIESLQREIARARERLDQGQVRAPVNGLLVKRHCSAGEQMRKMQPVFTILEEGSLEVVLYLPQPISTRYRVGDRMELVVEPYRKQLRVTVFRIGERFETAPESIARNYRKDQQLLPMHVRPDPEVTRWMALRVGGVAKLPYFWSRLPGAGE